MRNIAFKVSLIFIFLIPWEGMVRLPWGTVARLLGLATGGVWLATVVITGGMRKLTPFHLMVCLLVFWNALSVFWSENPNRTFAHAKTWGQLLLMVFILWDLYTTQAHLLAGLQAYILGAYVALGSAVYNYLTGNAYYTNYQRFSPGETNPDGFGFLIALGMPVAWYLASSNIGKAGHLWRFVNYAYIPTAFLGIALSGTRTALIGSLVGTAFGLATLNRLRLASRIAIFAFLTSVIFILLPYVETLESFQRLGTTASELTSGDLNNRTNNWREGLASFEEHPLLGVGGNMYRSINSLAADASGKVGHNTYLSVLVELGLVGFALFGTILAIVFFQAWRQPGWQSWFWLTVLAVWGIGAFTLTWESRKSTWLFLGFIVISAALARNPARETNILSSSPVEPGAVGSKEVLSGGGSLG